MVHGNLQACKIYFKLDTNRVPSTEPQKQVKILETISLFTNVQIGTAKVVVDKFAHHHHCFTILILMLSNTAMAQRMQKNGIFNVIIIKIEQQTSTSRL